jgi:hypothetical protein
MRDPPRLQRARWLRPEASLLRTRLPSLSEPARDTASALCGVSDIGTDGGRAALTGARYDGSGCCVARPVLPRCGAGRAPAHRRSVCLLRTAGQTATQIVWPTRIRTDVRALAKAWHHCREIHQYRVCEAFVETAISNVRLRGELSAHVSLNSMPVSTNERTPRAFSP